jgi:hypothetical protein
MTPFNTPADIPANDSVPDFISQFFGRKFPRNKPELDLDEFAAQFFRIDIYGATACVNQGTAYQIFDCMSGSKKVFDTTCDISATTSEEQKLFGYTSKIKLSLRRLVDDSIIKFPSDSNIRCELHYQAQTDNYVRTTNKLAVNIL